MGFIPKPSPTLAVRRFVLACLLLLLLFTLKPESTRAAAPAPALSWVREPGAENCITSIELAKKIEGALKRAIFVSASEADLVVEGYIRPSDTGGYSAKLILTDRSGKPLGSRDLTTEQQDCKALDEALVLVIAVTLYPKSGLAGVSMLPPESASILDELFAEPTGPDSELLDVNIPAPASKEQNRKQTARPLSSSAPKPEQQQPTRSPQPGTAVIVGAGGAIGTGLLPGLNFGINAVIGLMLRDIWPIEISGIYWLPNYASIAGTKKASRNIDIAYAGPSICPLSWRWYRWSSMGCLGVQFGAIHVATKGLLEDSSTTKPLINLDFSADLEVEIIESIFPRLGIRADFPALQHNFRYVDRQGVSQELFYMPQVGVDAELGLKIKF
jgi:hypothetical protein